MKDTRFAKLVLFVNSLVPLVLLLWDLWRKRGRQSARICNPHDGNADARLSTLDAGG